MDYQKIYPLDVFSDTENSMPAFFGSLLNRTNFVVNVRNYLGWRGVKVSVLNGESWTCKIKGKKGVYGISFFRVLHQKNDFLEGIFKLFYFPHPKEQIIESYPISAEMISNLGDYTPFIRDFLTYPEFTHLFEIGSINLAFAKNRQQLSCSLIASKSLQTSPEGCTSFNERETAVRSLKAFQLCFPFYEVLAATFTYNLEQKPTTFVHGVRGEDDSSIEEMHLIYSSDRVNLSFLEKCRNTEKFVEYSKWKESENIPRNFEKERWWDAHLHSLKPKLDKAGLGIDDRPQLIVLSGYLGSGKTTFLKHFIEYHTQNNRFVAVIQNEIGEKGLDAKLLEDEYAVLEMDEGCVCCSLLGQLQKGILQIIADHRPEIIVLETTGLANPFNLLNELDGIQHLIRFDSVSCMLDAKNFQIARRQSLVVEEQIKAADFIILNKTDLVSCNQIESIKTELTLLNSRALIQTSSYGDINPALLSSMNCDKEYNEIKDRKGKTSKSSHHFHMQDGITSKRILFKKRLNKTDFLEKIKSLPPSIYRVKGVIEFEGEDQQSVFQYVNGRYEIETEINKKTNECFLVLIGDKISLNKMNHFFFN